MPRYRLTRPLSGRIAGENRTITIPAGSLVEKDDFLARVGLIEVLWGERRVAVFVQDFVEFGQPLDSLMG